MIWFAKSHFSNKFLIALSIFAFLASWILITTLTKDVLIYLNYKEYNQNGQQIYRDLENILSPLWSVSNEQLLIDPKIIIKTLKFMIEEKDETDPELVEFVRTLIKPPIKPDSDKKLNLVSKKYDYSQIGQSIFVDKLLGEKRDGFFIEAGANNGEKYSNSLFFELNRGWTGDFGQEIFSENKSSINIFIYFIFKGILIEPVPSFFKNIVSKNRNAYILNACIARDKPIISKFRIYRMLTGRFKEMNVKHQKRIDKESRKSMSKLGYFPCFSLKTIMKALNVSHVDYFSLDVEGGELDVLKSLNFNELDITTFSIEHNDYNETKEEITSLMERNGYTTEKLDEQDGYYKKFSKIAK